jgi:hypothetical protein
LFARFYLGNNKNKTAQKRVGRVVQSEFKHQSTHTHTHTHTRTRTCTQSLLGFCREIEPIECLFDVRLKRGIEG